MGAFGTLVLFAPRRFLAVVWLLLGLLVAPIARKWAAVSLVAAAVSAVWFGGYALPAIPAAEPSPALAQNGAAPEPPIRLVTYNVDYATSLGLSLLAATGRWNADVILLQACGNEAAGDLSRATLTRTPSLPRMRVTRVGEFCIASHLPYITAAIIGETGGRTEERSGRAIGVHVRVARATDTISFVSVHLASPRIALTRALQFDFSGVPRMAASRQREAMVLSRYLARITEPLVVAGDFNTPQESQIYATYFGGFGNAFRETGSGFGFTMRAGVHRLRIDHVLTGPSVRALALEVEDDWPTEHHPVIVDLEVR